MAGTDTQTRHWWTATGPWVETPNTDRGGFSGVQYVDAADGARYFVKRQNSYLFRSLRYPGGRPTLLREYRNFQRYARLGLRTPDVVHFDMRRREGQWQAILVTRALDGYVSLREALVSNRWSAERRRAVLDAVMSAVLVLHRLGLKHGHLYPKEVFIEDRGDVPQVAFLDLELSRRCLTAGEAAASDLKRFLKGMFELGMSYDDYQRVLDCYARASIVLPARVTDQGARYFSQSDSDIPLLAHFD